jgi:glycogen debranching enzyme
MSEGRTNNSLPYVFIPNVELTESSLSPVTPKTPADEGIEFFQSAVQRDTPIRVYELRLDSDGGPNKYASV